MGVDITAIIGHQLSMDEVLQLPAIISAWADVDALTNAFHANQPGFDPLEEGAPSASWATECENLEAASILHVWEYWSTDEDDSNIPTPFTIDIDTSFGWLKVNRHTICICPFEHQFANLEDAKTRTYLVLLFRMIALHLGSSEVVIVPDSAFPEAFVEEMSFAGRSMEEIIAFGQEKFGESVVVPSMNSGSKFYVDRF